jgi:hypothetical protein
MSCPGCGSFGPICEEHKAAFAVDPFEVLKRYEQWEANLINEPEAWAGMAALPTLTQELWDELMEIQGLRNRVVAP